MATDTSTRSFALLPRVGGFSGFRHSSALTAAIADHMAAAGWQYVGPTSTIGTYAPPQQANEWLMVCLERAGDEQIESVSGQVVLPLVATPFGVFVESLLKEFALRLVVD